MIRDDMGSRGGLARLVRRVRKGHGLTMAALGERLSKPRGYIARIESGEIPSAAVTARLAVALALDPVGVLAVRRWAVLKRAQELASLRCNRDEAEALAALSEKPPRKSKRKPDETGQPKKGV